MTDDSAPSPSAGYDGPSGPNTHSEYSTPSPADQTWRIEKAAMLVEDETVIVRILLDDEPVGMIRLPSLAHLRYMRERLQT